jgi:hypothetical protein
MYVACIPLKKAFVGEVLLSLVEKTMTTYVQLALVDYLLATYNFDLWMSKGMQDVFVVVVSFISNDWEAKHVTIGLFEVLNTSSATMVLKLQKL